jgi:hypothetical protein
MVGNNPSGFEVFRDRDRVFYIDAEYYRLFAI